MSKYYLDYVWKEGIPYGVEPISDLSKITYKIAMDPYRKRIAIECYQNKRLQSVVYDSGLLDFRHLKPSEQTAWQKIPLTEEAESASCAIYNQDDRLVLIETYVFEGKFCRRCRSTSGHGIFLCEQKMFYKALGDSFNGVILFDSNAHPVMYKQYEANEDGEFTELIEEIWNSSKILEASKVDLFSASE